MKRTDAKTLVAIAVALCLAGALARATGTDDRIEKAARESYVFKTYLKADHVTVESKNGLVTLTGTVAENVNRSLAEEAVSSLPGVQRVDNQLVVKEPRPIRRSDDVISAKVKAALLFHRNVSASRAKVSAADGVVTLRGEAGSDAEKDLTAEYARDVEGVKSVINLMTIRQHPEPDRTIGQKIDDVSITAQVKTALLTHRSTSLLHTTVATADGVVTLTGPARNIAEKELVTKLVSDIDGVKDVKNQMTVQDRAQNE